MDNKKIPKIVHYCWFGMSEKPDNVKKCINSWKEKLTGYKIIEWNENNFDISYLKYTKDAYEAKKYAFVSDVARIKALLQYGGIYLDTDVEVLKSFDDILDNKCVLGFEEKDYIATSFMAAVPGHSLIKEFVELYNDLEFYDKKGNIIPGTNVGKLTEMLEEKGLERNGRYQIIEDNITVYPQEYFSPYDYINCYYNITDKSICVHYFYVSWIPATARIKKRIKSICSTIIKPETMNKFRETLKK